jgi:hypothetical protein
MVKTGISKEKDRTQEARLTTWHPGHGPLFKALLSYIILATLLSGNVQMTEWGVSVNTCPRWARKDSAVV